MLTYCATPIQEISDDIVRNAGVRLIVKREDLNHPTVSGNKWWKLKYNLEAAVKSQASTLLTYGGAFSNHIFATAAAASEIGLKSVGIIRGEESLPLNPVLSFAQAHGMELHYISRTHYRSKSASDIYLNKFNNFYWIPEGGSNFQAVKGVKEFASSLHVDYDYLCCPVGTGGTLSGLIEGTTPEKTILGFAVLKAPEFLNDEVRRLSEKSNDALNWHLVSDYHFGGYAKTPASLLHFIENFQELHKVPLDKIYTGKMMAGIYDLLAKGFFKRGSTILAIHTGGLQQPLDINLL